MAERIKEYTRARDPRASAGSAPIKYRSPEFDPHPETKRRKCLNPACGRTFMSQHFGVRFCQPCRKEIRTSDDLPGRGFYKESEREDARG